MSTGLDSASSTTGRDPAWHALDAHSVANQFETDSERGLGAAEARQRLRVHGPNLLRTASKTTWYRVLGRQFIDVLVVILVVAAAVSLAIGEVTDAVTILIIVVLNALLGFAQEWKAEKAIEALLRILSPQCTAVRDGSERRVDAEDLVPGDIVVLEVGDRVPADLRLVRALNLKVDESALTGESGSVSKKIETVAEDAPLAERASIAWMGTSVTNGHGLGAVVATGMGTEFGRIAGLTETVGREITPLQRKLATLGKQLGLFSIVVAVGVSTVGWLLGKPLIEMFMTGVSLAVAVVPEGLPTVVTITLALGIRAMVRHRALLRRLQAAETLGSATMICTDKTGTLTKNEMTVQRIRLAGEELTVTGVGYDPAGHFEGAGHRIDYREHPDLLALLETGLRCNHARLVKEGDRWNEIGEPTEAALVVAAYKAWLHPDDCGPTVTEFSFDSTRKRMTVIEHGAEGLMAHVKGAPEVILGRCTRVCEAGVERELMDPDRAAFEAAYEKLARSGLRTLALARRKLAEGESLEEDAVENELTLLGVVGIIDPPRPEVPVAIRVADEAGIGVILITGDAAATALAIAQRIGLSTERAITGGELDETDDGELREALARGDALFARVTPEHKMRIVRLLQELGHVVGMTGDGVNDAPALKQADIGIAMGIRGTDVAKEASDMVLTDDNFASIVGAIEEGRRQYDNIQKFVRYLLSSNAGEIVAIFANILIGGPLILLPVQILWINLVTDGVTAVALGLEPAERGIMRRPPRPVRSQIIDQSGVLTILLLGSYIGLTTLWLFHHYLGSEDPDAGARAQTMAFAGIILVEMVNVFNFRTLRAPMRAVGYRSNGWLLIAWVVTLGLQFCAIYVPFLQSSLRTVPLHASDWVLLLTVSLPIFVLVEAFKRLRWSRRPASKPDGCSPSRSR